MLLALKGEGNGVDCWLGGNGLRTYLIPAIFVLICVDFG